MNRFDRFRYLVRGALTQALLVATSAYVWLAMSGVALAAKKKAAEPVADQGKGYTVSYMFVIAMVALGLMAVLRPGRRLEKVDDKIKGKESE